jgi:hypothetical protein
VAVAVFRTAPFHPPLPDFCETTIKRCSVLFTDVNPAALRVLLLKSGMRRVNDSKKLRNKTLTTNNNEPQQQQQKAAVERSKHIL